MTIAERITVTGLLPPIPTPFRDGLLDADSLKRMLVDLGDNVDGILAGGSVGETASLTVEERIELMQTVAGELGPDSQLTVSIADNALPNVRRLSEAAGEAGAQLLVLSVPNYFENTLSMLVEYFGAVAEFATADLCLYDNPVASHTTLSVEDIAGLAEAVPRLTHIKVTDTALGKVAALRERTDLTLHAGDDAVLWHQLVGGVHGAMVAMPLIYPSETRQLWSLIAAGETDEAFELYTNMARFTHLALGAPDYAPVIKAIMHHRGVIASPEVRLPLQTPNPRRLAEVIASL
jgi:dihydrodipicolinate synthase/N-acetylneuraminate lyase